MRIFSVIKKLYTIFIYLTKYIFQITARVLIIFLYNCFYYFTINTIFMNEKKGTVAIVRPLKQNVSLSYRIPEDFRSVVTIGTFVIIPIKNREVIGVVTSLYSEKQPSSFALRDIIGVKKELSDALYLAFLKTISWYYQVKKEFFFTHLWNFLNSDNKKDKKVTVEAQDTQQIMPTLTKEQQEIVDVIAPDIITPKNSISLIHGVTGSGKTECYKALIKEAILAKKIALLLLPEVTLAQAFEHRLKKEMPDVTIYGFHSGNSKKERAAVFDALQQSNPILIIGVHLPIMLPIATLGLIIIDEEHDSGYQEKNHPKLNTKEIALFRGQQYNIPVVLGSATPSITTLYNIEHKSWRLFSLHTRFSGSFPIVKQVSLLEKDRRKSFWISKQLEREIANRLEKKEQTLIFLNRRGLHFFVQCSACSFIFTCSSCAVSLTLHENNTLMCHYCARTMQLAKRCPQCTKSEKNFIKKGTGTQQLVTMLHSLFPQATIARLDADVRKKTGATENVLEKMQNGSIDILVGTQSIARGLHFEKVSLVGIIWADLHFHLPIYNAVEHAMQQLIQVAGRAGRSNTTKENLVVVQTMTNHQALSYLSEKEYRNLYQQECANRKQFSYPPFVRLAEIELRNKDEKLLEVESQKIVKTLEEYNMQKGMSVRILGPTKPAITKIDNVYYMKLYLKSRQISDIIQLYKYISENNYESKHFFIPNSTSL